MKWLKGCIVLTTLHNMTIYNQIEPNFIFLKDKPSKQIGGKSR